MYINGSFFKKIIYLLLFPFFMTSMMVSAESQVSKDSSMYLHRPLWSAGFNDADWLAANVKKGGSQFAFYTLSRSVIGDKSTLEELDEYEDARISRALPLYLSEILMNHTTCSAENYIQADNRGFDPSVMSKAGVTADFIVYGHLVRDYLATRHTITIMVWSVDKRQQLFEVSSSALLASSIDVAAEVQRLFFKKIISKTNCKIQPNKLYSIPTAELAPLYIEALSKLLLQVMVVDGMVAKKHLLGEQRLLNEYDYLWDKFPNSNAPKLMYVRGLLASLDNGSKLRESTLINFNEYMRLAANNADVITLLSPFIYARLGNIGKCYRAKTNMLAIKNAAYQQWLNQFECNEFKR